MSGVVTEQELMQASESDATGVSVFGHVAVADTFLIICAMSRQERRVLAAKLAAYDAPMADEFAQDIIDAVFPIAENADDRMLVDSGILRELVTETQTATQPKALADSYVLNLPKNTTA